jgi:hypothetical protein
MLCRSLLCVLSGAGAAAAAGEPVVITDRLHHLGVADKPEWEEFTTVRPAHRNQLDVEFQARAGASDYTLEIQAGDVEMDWRVRLNGQEIGSLRRGSELTTTYLAVPAAAVKDGANQLRVSFQAFRRAEDIYVGKALLHDRPLREVAGYARVTVRVRDPDSGKDLPCRLTISRKAERKDNRGRATVSEELVDVLPVKEQENDLAARRGIIYTKNGLAAFDVVAGKYMLYATRGFEYGLAAAPLELGRQEEKSVDLELRREVDTTGLLAADTHVHTRTYSFHGDIELDERVIAIAGEGVELAVATDHNHHTDYRPTMEDAGLKDAFFSVVGNEITTSWGHFNAFPVKRDEPPADHDHSDWTNLIKAMRASSGVRVIIVNHPRRTLADASEPAGGAAFHHVGLNPTSGEAHGGPPSLGIDAVEVLNGKTLEPDGMLTLNDWFGMVNRGYRVAAVAGSDSHAVNEIVGQARTYVTSSTDDPRRINIQEVCDAFIAGRLLVSLGLLTRVEVEGRHRPGDLAVDLGAEVEVKVRVQGPSWARAESVAVYLNGIEARREKIEPSAGPLDQQVTWRLPRPSHDAHLVAVAIGPPVTGLYWPISGDGKRYTLGATNAVWLDGDGDGKFTSAFEYASRIASVHGLLGEGTRQALARYDAAVVAQFASIVRAKVQADFQTAYERLLAEADGRLAELLASDQPALMAGFGRYLAAAPKVDVNTRADQEEKAATLEREEASRKKRKEDAKRRGPRGRRGERGQPENREGRRGRI